MADKIEETMFVKSKQKKQYNINKFQIPLFKSLSSYSFYYVETWVWDHDI